MNNGSSDPFTFLLRTDRIHSPDNRSPMMILLDLRNTVGHLAFF